MEDTISLCANAQCIESKRVLCPRSGHEPLHSKIYIKKQFALPANDSYQLTRISPEESACLLPVAQISFHFAGIFKRKNVGSPLTSHLSPQSLARMES